MHILFICYYYAPQTHIIGAIRPIKLCKYINKDGYDIDVLTLQFDSSKISNNIEQGLSVTRLPHSKVAYKLLHKLESAKTQIGKNNTTNNQHKNKKNFFSGLREFIRQVFYYFYLQYDYFHQFKCYYRKNKKHFSKYTTVISTYNPVAPLLCAMYMKKRHKSLNWICDFRDPMVVESLPRWFNIYNGYIQSKACKLANVITTVSNGYLKRICDEKTKTKAYMISNGYDTEDIQDLYVKDSKDFSFAYTGTLYSGKRDLTPIFKALKELSDENLIDLTKISFHYAGSEESVIMEQAYKYNVQCIIVPHGQITRQECLKIQKYSRFLVLSTWNNCGEEGVFPGKLLEYMMIKKPIIAIVDGNFANSEVANLIKKANLGVAYEAVNNKDDYIILKNYIYNQYKKFISKLELEYEPVNEIVGNYNYINIAKQFEELIS